MLLDDQQLGDHSSAKIPTSTNNTTGPQMRQTRAPSVQLSAKFAA